MIKSKVMRKLGAALVVSASLCASPLSLQGKQILELDLARHGTPTQELLVYLQPGVNVEEFARRYNLELVRALVSREDAFVFSGKSVDHVQALEPNIAQDRSVVAVYNNRVTIMLPHEPNDPFYHEGASEWGQWYLDNKYGWPDIDANDAWTMASGKGVVIGVVDSGVDYLHEDLDVDQSLGYDFVEDDEDSFPYENSYHGTAVAGVATAIGNNGIGVIGVAPGASVAGLRVPLNGTFNLAENPGPTAAQYVDAIHYANNDITIKNHSYGKILKYSSSNVPGVSSIVDALRQSSLETGVIHVFSAGNERQDTAGRTTATLPEVISVAALGYDGVFASYSNYGASVFVTAPSGQDDVGIVTTDITGFYGATGPVDNPVDPFPHSGYMSQFSGTSASAPQLAGALALVKGLRPELDSRLAKHLLVNSSIVVDATDDSEESDGGWSVNAAGCAFNQNYGFGLLNTRNLLNLANSRFTVGPLRQWNSGPIQSRPRPAANVPDGGRLSYSIPVGQCVKPTSCALIGADPLGPLEEVGITLDIRHSRRGDVEVILKSPSGTSSRLLRSYTGLPEAVYDWATVDWATVGVDPADIETFDEIKHTFWSNAFWGENPGGKWTLHVDDRRADKVGSVISVEMHLRSGEVISPDGDFQICANQGL